VRLEIRIKYVDAIAMVVRSLWLPFILAIGLLFFRGQMDLETFGFTLSVILGCLLVVSLFVYAVPCLAMTPEGIAFKNWRGRDVLASWSQDLQIKCGKYGAVPVVNFKVPKARKTYQIPSVVFSYPDVKNFVENFAPSGHPIKDFVKVD
jgi:hypothetical protein